MIDVSHFKVIAFDADGTLRRCTVAGQPCPNKPGEWELLPGVRDTIQSIDWSHLGAAIVSNQAGVATGYLTAEMARQLLLDTANAVWMPIVPFLFSVHYCPHAVNGGCSCRKPKPGLLYELCHQHACRPKEVLFVGDMESDAGAALAAGCFFIYANSFFGWQ